MMEVYICLMFIMFAHSIQSLCTNEKMQPLQKAYQEMCIQNMQVDCSKDVNVKWVKPVKSLYVKEYTVRIKNSETGNLVAEKGLPNTSSSWSHTLTENLTRIQVEVWSLNNWGYDTRLNTVISKDCTIPYAVTSKIQTSTSRSTDSSTSSMDILTYVTMTSSTHNFTYGNHITLLCTSDCLSPCTYTWYKNNTHLHWISRSDYTIEKLSSGDTGTYVCLVRKGNLSKSSDAFNITVTGIANVQLKMSSDNIIEGKTRNLNISCQAECNPPCKYTLLKDGNIQKNSVIDQVSRTDSGGYQCLAENSVTSDRSLVKLLNVKYGPAHANASLPRYLIRGDKAISLKCSADCLPACSYTWFKGRKVVSNTQYIYFRPKVKTMDEGNYTCQATNEIGEAFVSKYIEVLVKPSKLNVTASKTYPTENEQFSIECNTKRLCLPSCKFFWSNVTSGQNVSSTRKLTFKSVQRTHAGSYTCTAYNELGQKSKTISFQIYYANVLMDISPSKQYVRVGDPFPKIQCRMDCYRSCNNLAYYKMKGSGRKQRIHMRQRIVNANDKGTYYCKATYYNNTSRRRIDIFSTSFSITVILKPSKLRITESKTYPAENEQFSIECNTKRPCVPSCKFFWINVTSGQNVSFNRNLTFKSVQRTHAGNYTCTAYNEVGQNSKTKSFQVYYANVLMNVSPSKQYVRVGDSFPTIQCRVDCYRSCNNLAYYKIDSSGRKTRIHMRQRIVNANDKGKYYCKATYFNYTSGRRIDISSTSFSITVIYDMLFINSREPTLQITEGRALSNLFCILRCHPPCSELSLYKNGRLERSMQTTSIFGVSPLLRNSSGHYKCKAKTAAGQILTSEEVFVDIQYKPVIYPSFANKIVLKERESFNTSLTLESNPAAVLRIFKNREITNYRPIKAHNDSLYSLSLSNVTCWDKGYYEVEAVNSIGYHSKPFNLSVMCAPRLQDGNVKSNMSVTLPIFSKTTRQWEIYSHPESNVVVTFQNDEKRSKKIDESFGVFHQLTQTSNGSVFRFSVLNVTEEHFGLYTILIQNSVGSLHLSLNITPTGPPLPPTNLSVDCSKPTQSLLSWIPQFPGGSPQIFKIHMWSNNTWVKIKENITDDSNEKGLVDVVLDDLAEDEHYEFSISAMNRESKEVYALDTVNCTILELSTGVVKGMVSTNIVSAHIEAETDVFECRTVGTIRVHKTSSSIDMTGSAVGTCASLVLIALIIVILVIRRKRRDNTKSTTRSFQDENVVGSLDIIASGRNEYVYSHITPTRLKETPFEGALYAEVDKSRKGGHGPIQSDVCPSAISQTYDVPKSSRWKNQDGLIYTEVEFTKSQSDSNTIIGDDVRTTYTEVEFVKP